MGQKILYIYEGKLTRHGIDAVVREQLHALVGRGFQVDLVSRGNPGLEGVAFRGMRWTPANALSWLPRSFYYPAQKRVFRALGAFFARRGGYAKIISWRDRALGAFRAAEEQGTGCYLNYDTNHWSRWAASTTDPRWPGFSRAEMDEEYRRSTAILLPSETSHDSFAGFVTPEEKLRIIGRGADTDRFKPSPKRAQRPFRLVFCGRVGERKGIRQVVEAWKRAGLADAELLVIGQIDRDVADLVEANSGANIKWMGFQSELPPILATCHAQILLSRNEGMAKSLLEGAACELATIATLDCGFPLNHGDNGFLVKREDTEDVAMRMRELRDNAALCLAMGQRGRATIVDHYSWAAFRKHFLQAIDLDP